MKKVLVTGANGMLGNALIPELKTAGFSVCATDICCSKDIVFLDINDPEGTKKIIYEFCPDIIFHLAAETDVDKCELNPDHAYEVNARGTENIAGVCAEKDITLVYISTMGVFDGKKESPYNESDQPNPINVYSRTKLDGEEAAQKLLKKYYIVRAGWMMGGGRKDKKFVAKILDFIETGKPIYAVTDKYGSPTFTRDLSICMIKLIQTGKYGIYHITNKGCCSRYDIALKMVRLLNKDVTVHPVTSDAFPLPALRPSSEASGSVKLNSLGIDVMRPWQDALEEYLNILVREENAK